MMIKKIIYILIVFIILTSANLALAQEGYLEYNIYGYRFKPTDKVLFLKNGNENLKLYEQSKIDNDRMEYLQEAMRYYFLVTKIDNNSINAHIGLGTVYDEMHLDKYAQEHFFKAYNLNRNNADLNLRFGDFYYKRKNYIKALSYYKIAYRYGYSSNFDLNKKIAIIYDKLADLDSSRDFYLNALRLDPKNKDLIKKIKSLDNINYKDSQYYLFQNK